MVYYFDSNEVTPAAVIYVGKDKFESLSPSVLHISECLRVLLIQC